MLLYEWVSETHKWSLDIEVRQLLLYSKLLAVNSTCSTTFVPETEDKGHVNEGHVNTAAAGIRTQTVRKSERGGEEGREGGRERGIDR